MTDWKIGVTTSTLVTLRNPSDSQPSLNILGTGRTSIDGTQSFDLVAKKWTTTWTWTNISDDDYEDIVAFADGTHGDGPFAVVDPTIGTSTLTMNVTSFTPNPSTYFGLWSPELVLTEV